MEIDRLVDIRKWERNVKSDINNVAVKAEEKYRRQQPRGLKNEFLKIGLFKCPALF
jgi:hypothetical protein